MALASGWLIAVIVYMLGAAVALLTVCGIPLGSPACEAGPAYLTLNFGFAAAGAIMGGYTAARLGCSEPVVHALVLAAVLAGFALWGFSKPGSQWPVWYPWALALVGAGGASVGGMLRKARQGQGR